MYDKTLEFENRKEEPVRYNRDLMVKTIQAMKRIEEIKIRRQKDHWRERMRIARLKNPNELSNVLEKHVTLIKDEKMREKVRKRISKKRNKKIKKQDKLKSLLIEESESEEEDLIVKEKLKKDDDEIEMESEPMQIE
jgi:large subunit ribosomal protein L24e